MRNANDNVPYVSRKNGEGMSKIQRYGWTCEKIPPGTQEWLFPSAINFDYSYQRERNEDKILEMARAFNWGAFGVVVVNMRPDGTLWGVDGMHRVLASLRRSDIEKIPALIVKIPPDDEPRLFLALNTLRKAVNGLDKFRAELKSRLPSATLVNELITGSGLQVARASGNSSTLGKTGVRCIATLKRWASNHPDVLVRVWPIIKTMSDSLATGGNGITDWVVDSLCFIEWRLEKQSKSLTRAPWKARVIALGIDGVNRAAKEAAAYYAKGGAKVWADGVVRALNKGMRHRLNLFPSADSDDGDSVVDK
jgi:hypothetical protein